MSDARDEAIAAVCRQWRNIRFTHRGSDESYFGRLIDAIPAEVLAQLAIERGGLIQVDEWSSTARRGIPLYRLVTS